MSLSNQAKHTGSLTKQSKNTNSVTKQTKNTGGLDYGLAFLLQEMSDYLLQENGGKIILCETKNSLGFPTFSDQSKNTGILTNQVKN